MLSPALLKMSVKRQSICQQNNIMLTQLSDETGKRHNGRRRSSTASVQSSGDGAASPSSLSIQFRQHLQLLTMNSPTMQLHLDFNEATSSSSRRSSLSSSKLSQQLHKMSTAIAPRLLLARRSSGSDEAIEPAEIKIQPHQYTSDPTVAWEMLKTKRPIKRVIQMKLDTPVRPDAVRFVCIACSHDQMPKEIPQGDVLIVAGDFTSCGLPKEVKAFNHWLGTLKHAYKVVIAGNHECTFDEQFLKATSRSEAKELALRQALISSLAASKLASPRPLLTNGIYLQDGLIELFGITIYGTPWQPRNDNWAFNLPRGQPLLDKWNQIPAGVDVLITHTPPLGHGDLLRNGQRQGCAELLTSVMKRIKPKYHVFGHIHEGYGCSSDGYTKFINCCLTDENLELVNDPVIFDIAVHPHTKQHYLNNVKKVMKRFMKKEK